jgi:hypothetical protein
MGEKIWRFYYANHTLICARVKKYELLGIVMGRSHCNLGYESGPLVVLGQSIWELWSKDSDPHGICDNDDEFSVPNIYHGINWSCSRCSISPTLHSRCGINKGLIKRGSTIDHWRSRCKGCILWPTPYTYIHTYIQDVQCCYILLHDKYLTKSLRITTVNLKRPSRNFRICWYTFLTLFWPRGLRHELSSLARTLGSWVRISLEAWMSVCVYSVFVFGSGLATSDHSSKESYRMSYC